MRVYAASDLHGNLPDWPADADVVILAGDICPDFRAGSVRNAWAHVATDGQAQARWLDTEFREWLESRPGGIPVYAIWGNHDFVGEQPQYRELFESLPWTLLQDTGATVIDERGRELLTLHGTPWVPGLPRWAFYGTDAALQARAESIPKVDILVSHGPPLNAGDLVPGGSEKQVTKYGNLHGIRVGDAALRKFILSSPDAPRVVVCGHIHEDRGIHMQGDTTIYNVAAVDGFYDLHENPWTRVWVTDE